MKIDLVFRIRKVFKISSFGTIEGIIEIDMYNEHLEQSFHNFLLSHFRDMEEILGFQNYSNFFRFAKEVAISLKEQQIIEEIKRVSEELDMFVKDVENLLQQLFSTFVEINELLKTENRDSIYLYTLSN
jgi:hypothetical protein